jgi:predicted nucleic acid-binding protein
MIVVDTNIIAALYLEAQRSSQAEQLLVKNSNWAAPILWRSEFLNVLALYIRKGYLSLAQANQIMQEAMRLMQGREYEIVSLHVLELVNSSHCSAYDCEFVALAQDIETSLVTLDKKILNNFPEVAVSIDKFVGG